MEPGLQLSDIQEELSLTADTLSARLNELRDFLGSVRRELSVRDFAGELTDAVGRRVSASTVQRWLTQQGAPDAYEIVGIAKLARTTVERFMDGLRPPATKRRNKPKPAKQVKGTKHERPTPARRTASR